MRHKFGTPILRFMDKPAKQSSDVVECRICGLNYVPDSPNDQRIHSDEHLKLVRGALPKDVREFLKDFGWAIAHDDRAIKNHKVKWSQEIGKKAVVFSWWTRARSNGIADDQFDDYMNAHLAYVDAIVARDDQQIAMAKALITPWEQYA
jgi:hypothetical protein